MASGRGKASVAGISVSLLARIVETKEREIARGLPIAREPRQERIEVASRLRRPRAKDHDDGMADGALRLVAEVKQMSPSAGQLSTALTPAERALAYAESGATMVSVLCDGDFFGGSYADLESARRALDYAGFDVPLLAKEFVVDESQIRCAADHGADAVLLIVRLLSSSRLSELIAAARDQSIEPLVEVASDAELDAALSANAHLIGVNARDLDTLEMDAERAARVTARIPLRCVAVHLSGLRDDASVRAIAAGRADAALLGEALMREDDPRPLLRSLAAAAKAYHP